MDISKYKKRDGRYLCNSEQVKIPEISGRWIHEHAEEIKQKDGYPGGDLVTYRCPHCEEEWEEELPQ